ncbi:hypothetical protein CDAR_405621 [Caerostris darwini]|uniref:Uncharacterized protein n=1 Tax=Caerostris darwini TaxID=1538125 RepID=A0AAV4PYG5_9ARAC|nr:hypothetical protein CDAR_405621 [Caerostris darwini]
MSFSNPFVRTLTIHSIKQQHLPQTHYTSTKPLKCRARNLPFENSLLKQEFDVQIARPYLKTFLNSRRKDEAPRQYSLLKSQNSSPVFYKWQLIYNSHLRVGRGEVIVFLKGINCSASVFSCHFVSRSREMSLGDVYVNDGLGQELNEEENFSSEKFLFLKVLFFIGSAVPVKYGCRVFWAYLGPLEMSLLMD